MYNTIILGSGYYSLGYAVSHENSIIVEKTQLCDVNFYGTYNGYKGKNYDILSEECINLNQYFNSVGVISDMNINVNALESAFCSWLKNKPVKILLNTECVSVAYENGMYCVKIYNNGGLDTLYSYKLIDTRQKNKKYLNVLVQADEEGLKSLSGKYPVSEAFYPGEYIVKYKCESNINIAKIEFYNMWKSIVPSDKNRIIAYAYSMYGDINEAEVNDLRFGDIFEAFDNGITAE